MDMTAALSAAGDLRGFDPRDQLAMVGLKAAMRQEQVVAQVVAQAVGAATQAGNAGATAPASPASGRLLDMRV